MSVYSIAHNGLQLGEGGVGVAFLIFFNKSKTNSLIFKQQKPFPSIRGGAKALLGAEWNPRRSRRELNDKLVCDLIRESGREL